MERNYEFEMDFLIGVIIAVAGTSRIGIFRQLANDIFVKLIIILSISHVITLTAVYSINRGTQYDISILAFFERASVYTLWFTTIGAIAYLFNIFANMSIDGFLLDIVDKIPRYSGEINAFYNNKPEIFQIATTIIPTVLVVGLLYFNVFVAMRKANNVDISIVPKSIHIREEYGDSHPISITIRNDSDDTIQGEISAEMPESVTWKESGSPTENNGDLNEGFSLHPDRQKILDIEFKHSLDDAQSKVRNVDLIIDHSYGLKEETIEMNLDNY